jgi:hypothetical protein
MSLDRDINPATVRYISKDHITISPAKGYSVTLFNVVEGSAVEAIVTADDGSETIRLLVAAPEPGRFMQIKKHEPTGIVNIIYQDKPHVG